jgi:hypothetical protein
MGSLVRRSEHMNVRAQKVRRRAGKLAVETGAVDNATRVADYEVKVALAAYFIAEKRGFEPGHELDDWLAAEAEVAQSGQPRVTQPIHLHQTENAS